MTRNDALAKIAQTARNPLQSIQDWKAKNGGKVVGVPSCMPPFAPEELIHAAGMLPVGIWGGEVPVSLADARIQSFACSVARTSLEMALHGAFSACDAFLFPFTCDAFQNLSEIWKLSVDRPCFQMVFPKKADRLSAKAYLEKELLRVGKELGDFSGVSLSAERLRRSISLYNEIRGGLRKLDELRARVPRSFSAMQMMETVLSSTFLPREEFSAMLHGLVSDLQSQSPGSGEAGSGVKVVLTGIMSRPAAVVSMLEELGFQVLGDDLGLGSLYYSLEVPQTGAPWEDLAAGYLSYGPCSTVHDPAACRKDSLLRRIRSTGAEGVLIFATKFCEPEFFDYPYLKQDLEGAGFKVLLLETELGAGEPGQIRTRLEAFLEIIREARNG